MTTFHSQQSDRGRRVRKNANADTFNFTSQIPPSICAVMHTKHDKPDATIFKSLCKSHGFGYRFYRWKPYPLSGQGFYGSPITRRKLRGVPRDGRAMSAKHPARNPAKFLASCPRNFPAMAGQWQRQCRRASARRLARQLALRRIWPRMSAPETRETTRNMSAQQPPTSRQQLARRLTQILTMTFKNYEHTNHTNARSRIAAQGGSGIPARSASRPVQRFETRP